MENVRKVGGVDMIGLRNQVVSLRKRLWEFSDFTSSDTYQSSSRVSFWGFQERERATKDEKRITHPSQLRVGRNAACLTSREVVKRTVEVWLASRGSKNTRGHMR